MVRKLRGRQRRKTRRRVDWHPAVLAEVDLHPGVRVVLAHDRLVKHRVVAPSRVSGGQSGRNPQAAQHQRLCGGELLAVADEAVKEEIVDRVCTRWYMTKLL